MKVIPIQIPKFINDELIKSGVEVEKIGLESGSISGYLTKGLLALGWKTICIDSRKMAAILSVTVNKTDKNDARGITDAMRCNHYKETHVRDDKDDAIGILLKSRSTLVRSRSTIKNTVRGHLKSYGIRLGAAGNIKFPSIVRSYYLKILPEAERGVESLLKSYETLCTEIIQMEKSIKEICRQDEVVQRLMTVPGVGKIVALTFKSDIGDASRFEKSVSVGAYGMAPRQYSSGEIVRQGRVSKCGSEDVRSLLIEAGVVLLTRTKAWSPLKAWGLKLLRKNGLKKASMAVGRKLAVIMHRMLITGESFKYSKKAA